MDFLEQQAECNDCCDNSSVSSNNERDNDLESFIDDQEYDDDFEEPSPFANVVRPIDGDPQPRLYDRNSVDGRDIDNFVKDKYRAETFRKTLFCFSEQHEESHLFFSVFLYGIYYFNNQNRPAADLTTACNAIREDKVEKLLEIKKTLC